MESLSSDSFTFSSMSDLSDISDVSDSESVLSDISDMDVSDIHSNKLMKGGMELLYAFPYITPGSGSSRPSATPPKHEKEAERLAAERPEAERPEAERPEATEQTKEERPEAKAKAAAVAAPSEEAAVAAAANTTAAAVAKAAAEENLELINNEFLYYLNNSLFESNFKEKLIENKGEEVNLDVFIEENIYELIRWYDFIIKKHKDFFKQSGNKKKN